MRSTVSLGDITAFMSCNPPKVGIEGVVIRKEKALAAAGNSRICHGCASVFEAKLSWAWKITPLLAAVVRTLQS